MPLYEVSSPSSYEVTSYKDQLTDALWYRASQRAVELLNMHDLQRADLRWPTPLYDTADCSAAAEPNAL